MTPGNIGIRGLDCRCHAYGRLPLQALESLFRGTMLTRKYRCKQLDYTKMPEPIS